MTVKKAIKILEWWIDQKNHSIDELMTNLNFHDKKLEQIILNSEKTIISNLESIKKELVPNCKHPKKMRDTTSDGQEYCMSCNWDL